MPTANRGRSASAIRASTAQLIDAAARVGHGRVHVGRLRAAAPDGIGGHHILDPRTGASPDAVASVTVVAPTAMLADALGTAAFVLGPAEGIRLLERAWRRGADRFAGARAL